MEADHWLLAMRAYRKIDNLKEVKIISVNFMDSK